VAESGNLDFEFPLFDVLALKRFDGPADPSLAQSLWLILHQMGIVSPVAHGPVIFFAYPLIPWVGVMAAGWAFGAIYGWEAERRRKVLYTVGIVATVMFIVLRIANVYGDPSPWSAQASPSQTILSFLNTTKYPPSLLFLLMTLGPSLIVLAATDGISGKAMWQRIAITFGPCADVLLHFAVVRGARHGHRADPSGGKIDQLLLHEFW
jgi:uncharacterized membrane protein